MPKIPSPKSCDVMLTVSEAAERLNVSERTVRRLIAEGKIRVYQFACIKPLRLRTIVESIRKQIDKIKDRTK